MITNEIKQVLDSLQKLTSESFGYNESTYFGSYNTEIKTTYTISSTLTGFKGVSKESQEELSESLELIEMQVRTLMQAKELQSRLDVKLIKQSDNEEV